MSLGNRIREQRKKLGLTQPQLSERIDMSLNSIKQLETDRVKPSIETLEKLTKLFGVTADYLLGRDEYHIDHYLPDSIVDPIIKQLNDKYGIDVKDDPEIRNIIMSAIESIRNKRKDT